MTVIVIGVKSAFEEGGDKRAIPEFRESVEGDCKFHKSYKFCDFKEAADAASTSGQWRTHSRGGVDLEVERRNPCDGWQILLVFVIKSALIDFAE